MKRTIVVVLAVLALAGGTPRAEGRLPARAARVVPAGAATRHTPTMAQFMSAGYPMELVAATKADRIAWIANDKGLRNVFTAAAPGFRAVRVTSFMKDDGINTTQLSISDDGTTVSFTRGHGARPASGPDHVVVHRRLRHVFLDRRCEERRCAGVLAQREGRAGLQRDQHDFLARRSRHLPARAGGVDAFLCGAGVGSNGPPPQHRTSGADGGVGRR